MEEWTLWQKATLSDDKKKHSNHAYDSPKSPLYSKRGLLSGRGTLLSISWERQTHIPIMTLVGTEKKRLGRGREVDRWIVIAQRLSIHQRKVMQRGIKGKWSPKPNSRQDNWSRKSSEKCPQRVKDEEFRGLKRGIFKSKVCPFEASLQSSNREFLMKRPHGSIEIPPSVQNP